MNPRPSIYEFKDIKNEIVYKDSAIKPVYKQPFTGQIKLFLNEVRFFENDVNIEKYNENNLLKKKYVVLYIGSGKGYHIPTLIDWYKDYPITWYLYDPNGHCRDLYQMKNTIEYKDSLYITNDYFLEKDIDYFKKIKKDKTLIFMSDIRTVDKDNKEPKTQNLLNDYELQNKILRELEPEFSLIKFRMPFPTDWKEGQSFLMPNSGKNNIYLQAFAPAYSAELRISLTSFISFEKISHINKLYEFEQKMFWYNTIYRKENNNDLKMAVYILNSYYQKNLENYIPLTEDNVNDTLKEIIKNFNRKYSY